MSKRGLDGVERHSKKLKGEKRNKSKATDESLVQEPDAGTGSAGLDLSETIDADMKKEKKSKKRKREDTSETTMENSNDIALVTEVDSKRKKSKSKKGHNSEIEANHTTFEPSSSLPEEIKQSKKKKSKKRQESQDGLILDNPTAIDETKDIAMERKDQESQKDKRKAKKQRKQIEDETVPENSENTQGARSEEITADSDIPPQEASHEEASNKARFIVFIGQLPFTATVDHVAKHFDKLAPSSIRLPTRREDETRNKGFAFLEFEAYDRMKTCLKLYHRSSFDDGISPPRKIKVELTAGGGGSNEQRKEKIRHKNERLSEQRRRRAHEEASQRFKQETKEKFAEAKDQQVKSGGPRGGPRVDQQLQENFIANGEQMNANLGGMHPDRLARLR